MYSIVLLAAFGTLGVANAVQTYDYIIVGGGTTGLVVANRLTEDHNTESVQKIRKTSFWAKESISRNCSRH